MKLYIMKNKVNYQTITLLHCKIRESSFLKKQLFVHDFAYNNILQS